MNIVADLHSHSPYAGASGKVDFEKLRYVMRIKGIDVYGSGDILLKKWEDELDSAFRFDSEKGMWDIGRGCYLIPQTEVIVTLPYLHNPAKRKLFHMVILFRGRRGIPEARKLFEHAASKLGIGRPFVKFNDTESMCLFFRRLKKETSCLLVPAHIMTPDGILGGKNRVEKIEDIFGQDTSLIDAVESGLSADPEMIKRVAGSLDVPVISSSDAHSAAFNRLGREFTELDVDELSAEGIAHAITSGRIVKTAEFPPFEGRYYLTGHRGDRPGHNGEDVFFMEYPPEICPVCGKKLTGGVRDLAEKLYPGGREREQDFVYQIPLVEVIAESLGLGSSSKKVTQLYLETIERAGRESSIWLEDSGIDFAGLPPEIAEGVERIKKGNYTVEYGFDGKYGRILF